MKRVLVGYFIRKTWKAPPHPGMTLHAETYDIYETREKAQAAIDSWPTRRRDSRFEYEVAEVWKRVHDEETAP